MKRIFPAHAYSEVPRDKCYWTSTIDTPNYPEAQGDLYADVAVMGSGFTGLNAALHLAEAGENVIVAENLRQACLRFSSLSKLDDTGPS